MLDDHDNADGVEGDDGVDSMDGVDEEDKIPPTRCIVGSDNRIREITSPMVDRHLDEIIRHIRWSFLSQHTIIILLYIPDQPCKYLPRTHYDNDDSDDDDGDEEDDHKNMMCRFLPLASPNAKGSVWNS